MYFGDNRQLFRFSEVTPLYLALFEWRVSALPHNLVIYLKRKEKRCCSSGITYTVNVALSQSSEGGPAELATGAEDRDDGTFHAFLSSAGDSQHSVAAESEI